MLHTDRHDHNDTIRHDRHDTIIPSDLAPDCINTTRLELLLRISIIIRISST